MLKFESTLHFSKYFTVVQIGLLLGSIFCILSLSWTVFAKVFIILVLLIYSAWCFYTHNQWKVIGQDKNGWYLQKATEKFYIVLSGDSTVTSFVSILRFGEFPKKSLVIFKDAMPGDRYRQMIVRCRYFNSI